MIEDHFGDGSAFRCSIEYLREQEPLGSGGCLSLLPEAPTAPVLVMNGDLLTRFNVGRLLDFHAHEDLVATIGVRNYSVEIPFGVVQVERARVTELIEKPTLNRDINAGIYAISPELFSRVPSGQMFPITSLFQDAISRGEGVGAYSIEEEWVDIGLPEQYFAHHQSGVGE